ncbi:hypothetical protein BU23DRAFT_574743 [Bimuria novae-zelandiae CBS 107.79]|uniref:Uncharacterized protein n=1 Tax=Bimuria novae-zelandiae CBS 107.79 TaxID=1447943 RepID=A0A6A5UNT0_9PLEO|nr:hypothetical protein BU23DRAFT_574743 [Bimuria novae-zelandiae CBS 107.79]
MKRQRSQTHLTVTGKREVSSACSAELAPNRPKVMDTKQTHSAQPDSAHSHSPPNMNTQVPATQSIPETDQAQPHDKMDTTTSTARSTPETENETTNKTTPTATPESKRIYWIRYDSSLADSNTAKGLGYTNDEALVALAQSFAAHPRLVSKNWRVTKYAALPATERNLKEQDGGEVKMKGDTWSTVQMYNAVMETRDWLADREKLAEVCSEGVGVDYVAWQELQTVMREDREKDRMVAPQRKKWEAARRKQSWQDIKRWGPGRLSTYSSESEENAQNQMELEEAMRRDREMDMAGKRMQKEGGMAAIREEELERMAREQALRWGFGPKDSGDDVTMVREREGRKKAAAAGKTPVHFNQFDFDMIEKLVELEAPKLDAQKDRKDAAEHERSASNLSTDIF